MNEFSTAFFRIGDAGKGSIWVGPRPITDRLQDWVSEASDHGINHVVSLIEEQEVAELGLDNQGEALATAGIGFTRFPVDNFDIPDQGAFRKLIADLNDRLAASETLFLHCFGGVGRAGTTASCLLVEHGWDADDAMAHVTKVRGFRSPETDAQEDFVRRWRA